MYWLITPLISAVWDWKTGDIPDWLTVPGLITSLFFMLLKAPYLLLPFVLFGIVGYLFYRYGLVGGGDILLILAIFPFLSLSPVDPIIVPFLVLFLGITLTSSLYGFYYYVKDGKYLYLLPVPFLPLGLSLLYGVVLFALLDKSRFVREVPMDQLQEEDVLAEFVEGFEKKVIEGGDKERLKSLGVERVKVLVNLPKMGPALSISILAALFPQVFLSILLIDPVLVLFHGS